MRKWAFLPTVSMLKSQHKIQVSYRTLLYQRFVHSFPQYVYATVEQVSDKCHYLQRYNPSLHQEADNEETGGRSGGIINNYLTFSGSMHLGNSKNSILCETQSFFKPQTVLRWPDGAQTRRLLSWMEFIHVRKFLWIYLRREQNLISTFLRQRWGRVEDCLWPVNAPPT